MLMHSLCTTVCPYAFYTEALDHMEAGKASILCSCEPAAAMVFGFFLFREIPAVLVLSNKKPEIVEENDHVKR